MSQAGARVIKAPGATIDFHNRAGGGMVRTTWRRIGDTARMTGSRAVCRGKDSARVGAHCLRYKDDLCMAGAT